MSRRLRLASVLVLLVLSASGVQAVASDPEPARDGSKTTAVVMWLGLGILSVSLLGIGLIWGVSRGAKWLLKRRGPTHTEMPDIWFLNPPPKRRQDKH